MQLTKKVIIKGQIKTLTGLAIGGTNAGMGIGGVDKSVVRNPISKEPYIPGSTLKGKMRSLLELRDNTLGDKPMGAVKTGPSDDPNAKAVKLFGNANQKDTQRPSRIIVRDAVLSEVQGNGSSKKDFFKNTELPFTEVKTEVVIDRITAKAMPRQLERVPAGTSFDFEMVVNIFTEDNEKQLMNDVFAALNLVQNDYIGGSGSRGSGQISFLIDTVVERSATFYKMEGAPEKPVTNDYKSIFPK
jgi:CRISPR-associated protein Csm3